MWLLKAQCLNMGWVTAQAKDTWGYFLNQSFQTLFHHQEGWNQTQLLVELGLLSAGETMQDVAAPPKSEEGASSMWSAGFAHSVYCVVWC